MIASVCSTDGWRIFPTPSRSLEDVCASSSRCYCVVSHCLEVKSETKVSKLGKRGENAKDSFPELTNIIRGLVDGECA